MCTDEEIKSKLLNFINTNENIRNDIELIREYIDLSILLFDSAKIDNKILAQDSVELELILIEKKESF